MVAASCRIESFQAKYMAKRKSNARFDDKIRHMIGENEGLQVKLRDAEEKIEMWKSELDGSQARKDVGVPYNHDTWSALVSENH
jgi:hypothetical protein